MRPPPSTLVRGVVIALMIVWCASSVITATESPRSLEHTIASDPPVLELTMCPGDRASVPISTTLTASPPRLDIAIAIEATGGEMSTPGHFAELLPQIFELLDARYADINYGVISFKDYPFSPYGVSGDWAFRVESVMTDDRESVRSAMSSFIGQGGGKSHSSFARVLFEAAHEDNLIGWREEARKVLILSGEDVPHDDDLSAGPLPLAYAIPWVTGIPPGFLDPGRSADVGVENDFSDDIDFQTALSALGEADITLFGLFSSGWLDRRVLVPYWDYWSQSTGPGGRAIIREFDGLPERMLSEITDITSHVAHVKVMASAGGSGWIESIEPPFLEDLELDAEGHTASFDVTLSPPDVTRPGLHVFDLEIRADGGAWSRQEVRITMDPMCTPPLPTQTPTRTSTATATATASSTPAPTATNPAPARRPIHLPWLGGPRRMVDRTAR